MKNSIFFLIILFTFSCKSSRTDLHQITQSIPIDKNTEILEIDSGIEVYLTQSTRDDASLKVSKEFIENLKIDIKNRKLKLTKKNKNRKEQIKVYVKIKKIHTIKLSEGAQVITKSFLTADSLQINSKEGSIATFSVQVKNLDCFTASGSKIVLSGTTNSIHFEAKSGSKIKAQHLTSKIGNVLAISGSKVWVSVSDVIKRHVENNGKIYLKGHPKSKTTL